jgi:hypothetical protein
LPEHWVPPAVHTPPVQHGWPAAPQVPQEPAPQVPPKVGQVEPAAEQALPTQQPPPLQTPPEQQPLPGSPHAEHVPVPVLAPVHTVPVSLHARFAQHISPLLPQARHTPALQTEAAAEQVLPVQQVSPS